MIPTGEQPMYENEADRSTASGQQAKRFYLHITPPPWAAIEEALLKLPASQPPPGAIPYASIIPSAARGLYLTGIGKDSRRACNENATPTAVAKELKQVRVRIDRLLETLGGLHKNTIDALNFRPMALQNLQRTLSLLAVSSKFSEVPPTIDDTARKMPRKIIARRTASLVAEHYRAITGEMPTPTIAEMSGAVNDGPFVKLLRVVFETCRIEASLDATAREAVKQITEKSRKK
jgi:hypothetical protein